jgi:LPS export ABC transporter permease LptG
MKIITRHLLREFIVPFAICLLTFVVLFVVFDLFDHISEFLDQSTPVRMIVLYYLFMIVPMLQHLAPASLMLAALYSLWRLSRSNEIVALRASGVSMSRVLGPFLAVGFLVSLGLLVMQETFVPRTYEWAMALNQNKFAPVEERVVKNSYYINQMATRQWRIGSFDMLHPETLRDVEISQESEDRRNLYKLTAPRADYLDGQWWFYSPLIQRFGQHDNPIGGAVAYGPASNSVVHVRELTELPAQFTNSQRNFEYLSVLDKKRFIASHPNLSAKELASMRMQLHERIAMPWACLILTLFAVPAGARTGRQGVLGTVFAAISLMVVFYATAQLGVALGATGRLHPAMAAWLANGCCSVIGLYLLASVR